MATSVDSVLSRLIRLLVPVAVLAAAALAVVMVIDRLAQDQRAADRRALIERNGQLTRSALAPGSALACLDSGAGDAAETACEAAVFASPQSTAAAVAYTAARLTLLADLRALAPADDNGLTGAVAGWRRALELDRYGIAAHVLSARDGCTADKCPSFALFNDASVLKANLKAQVFDQYVSRHQAAWSAPARPSVVEPVQGPNAPPGSIPMSQAPSPMPNAALASAPPDGERPSGHPVPDKYDFPSASSIPPVSIMNAEPALPKAAAEAHASQSKPESRAAEAVPVPPRRPHERPQAQTEQVVPPPAQ